jgi:hypothetical protein
VKSFWLNVLSTVLAAALVGNVAFMFQVSNRLARLEAKFETFEGAKTLAKVNEP